MPETLQTEAFLSRSMNGRIVDVRSPGEFAKGHIPGALNIPLFTDEERAVVGTIYKKNGRDKAVVEGLRFVGPKLAGFVEQLTTIPSDGSLGVHCWRGGQRSQSMAWLFEKAGRTQVHLLDGGYKAFRNHVIRSFDVPINIQILGGYTGSGKTDIIRALNDEGEQVVDLEGLAEHRGSAFGALGQKEQPRTEHFENLLYHAFSELDRSKRVWLEDESRHIGSCRLPDALYNQMREAPTLFLDIPQEVRVNRLVDEYGDFPYEQLADPIQRIGKRLGGQHVKSALEALENERLDEVARITLNYYDKAYRFGLEQRPIENRSELIPHDNDPASIAKACIAHVRNN